MFVPAKDGSDHPPSQALRYISSQQILRILIACGMTSVHAVDRGQRAAKVSSKVKQRVAGVKTRLGWEMNSSRGYFRRPNRG